MIKRNQKLINAMNVVTDMVLIILALLLSMSLRFNVLDGVVSLHISDSQLLVIAIVYSAVNVLLYYIAGIYSSFRFRRRSITARIALINAITTLCMIAILYLFKIMDFSRWALVFIWGFSSLFVILKHVIGETIVRKERAKSRNQKHFAIVGNGKLAFKFVEDIENNPELGITIDGYFSAVEKEGLGKCLGSYEELEEVLDGYELDSLVVALEAHEIKYMKEVLSVADKEGIRVHVIPFYNDYLPAHPVIESAGNTKLIDLRATPLDGAGNAFIKRAIDIVGSSILIILTSPIMLITAIGIKITSPGPVMFKHVRVGKDKKPFTMLKFRSMRIDTDHTGWSTQNDSRKTKFGSFIRKFSIDELPQFFNVFLGQMSLIGPRPELPNFVRQFKEEVPLYLIRQQVRPGITGWAQVNGLRGDTSIEDRVVYDIWYIENWSLALDCKILFKTVFGGFVNNENLNTGADKTDKTDKTGKTDKIDKIDEFEKTDETEKQ